MSALPLFASTVYFIRIGKFIKIGVTTDLKPRRGCPVVCDAHDG
jgi:hypothetical protein